MDDAKLKIKVLVIGMARSGRAGAEALVKLGADVTVYDKKEDDAKKVWADKIGVKADFGEKPSSAKGFDLLVLSPGVPEDLDYIIEAQNDGAEVIGELELAYRYGKGKYIAITGTNGKTTTTTLVGEIFEAGGRSTRVVGNIGTAVMTCAMDVDDDTYLVTECSSFQLDTTKEFEPLVSALLNITPDHLDRHKTMDNYVLAKSKIFANQNRSEYFIYNGDDELCIKASKMCKATVVPFSRTKDLSFGACVRNGKIVIEDVDGEYEICGADELKIPGLHNLENALAAAAIAHFAGIDSKTIADTLKSFEGVAHRLEDCGIKHGVHYVNDSKGTNPDAAIKAIISFHNIILIAGGYDKGAEFDEFVAAFDGRVKSLILMGVTAPKIRKAAEKAGFNSIFEVKNMAEAVKKAREISVEGDTVLLSPACASWDMYKKFEDRGDDFKAEVKKLD